MGSLHQFPGDLIGGWFTFVVIFLPFFLVGGLIWRLVPEKWNLQVLVPVWVVMAFGYAYWLGGRIGFGLLSAVAIFFIGMLLAYFAEERIGKWAGGVVYAVGALASACLVAWLFAGNTGVLVVLVLAAIVVAGVATLVWTQRTEADGATHEGLTEIELADEAAGAMSDSLAMAAAPTSAGWYPHTAPGLLRFWDGSEWTGQVIERPPTRA